MGLRSHQLYSNSSNITRKLLGNANKSTVFSIPVGSELNPALTATAIYNSGQTTNGVYYLKPTGAATAFQAYCDFSTPNGPWVHVGTAVGNTLGLWSVLSTWYSRTTNSGNYTDPTDASASSFNAGAFIYCKGNNIMLKEGGGNSGSGGSVGYTQCSGFTNESWRDVYNFIGSAGGWPSQPSINRTLTITTKTVGSSSLIYGGSYSSTNTYDSFGVYVFDSGGDTMCMLSTGAYDSSTNTWSSEADIGIGANEDGPSVSSFPNSNQTSGQAYDAGGNGLTIQTGWSGVPFSMWIKN